MAEIQSNEDAALRYVLGELNDVERREFELRLATDAELRACVGELETGLVAAATASPRRCPPATIWQRIEKAVAKETKVKLRFPNFWHGWLRYGWATAAACLTGWLLYAFWANHRYNSALARLKLSQRETVIVNSTAPSPIHDAVKSPAPVVTNIAFELLQSRTQEINELRGRIAQLETETTQLSRSLAQQQSLLSESSRIKFYHLVSDSVANNNPNPPPLSPGLQRAVSTALARELGWLPTTPQSVEQIGGNLPATPMTIAGVDFIDLRPGNNQQQVQLQSQSPSQPQNNQPVTDNNTATAQMQPQAQPQVDSQVQQPQSSATSQAASTSQPTIPAYVSGDNLVVALDSTVVPAGSSVMLTTYDANQNQTGGSFTLGNNPVVVTIPLSSDGYTPVLTTGLGMVITFTSPAGQTGTYYFSQPSLSQTP
ncbi:MAG TPA: hypothetical protein VHG71_00270 [Verrucomicrobiae bacterium]|nr:hypothetical protein [Verrucomicrobiae bacterium]